MRKPLLLVVLILILSVLACNTPQPGTTKPPPTTALETIESPSPDVPATAIPTVEPPTAIPPAEETSPTDTPIIMCTPPACNEGEVYYCPGECPGGCGTQCATPTAGPLSPPTIFSFTADRTTIIQGEEVTLSWEATGGTEAFIQWVGSNGIWAGGSISSDPNKGTFTAAPDGNGDIVLIVRNNAGDAEAHLQLVIECPHDWSPPLDGPPPMASGCPGGVVYTTGAQQSFERGFMIWLETQDTIFVFYDEGSSGSTPSPYKVYGDDFSEGDPESDPSIVPPAGLHQPVRGFGLVWRANPDVRDRLGWATAPEAEFQSWLQGFSGTGLHSSFTLLEGIDDTIYLLEAFGSTWKIYLP